MEHPWDSAFIGEDDSRYPLAGEDDVRIAVQRLTEQTRGELLILTQDMEPRIFDQEAFLAAVKTLARRSRRADIRIVARELDKAVKWGHRLIELSRHLSSTISIRLAGRRAQESSDAFLVADGRAVLYRSRATRPEGYVCFNEPMEGKKLRERFLQAWEEAQPDPNLRRLNL